MGTPKFLTSETFYDINDETMEEENHFQVDFYLKTTAAHDSLREAERLNLKTVKWID